MLGYLWNLLGLKNQPIQANTQKSIPTTVLDDNSEWEIMSFEENKNTPNLDLDLDQNPNPNPNPEHDVHCVVEINKQSEHLTAREMIYNINSKLEYDNFYNSGKNKYNKEQYSYGEKYKNIPNKKHLTHCIQQPSKKCKNKN